tara:strand:- start:319 stop:1146 length:828 start_codon:yes stop_codon:yes gene_type:complete
MEKFGILVLSYNGDLERANNLFKTIEKHNVENLPVYLMVDKQDKDLFVNKLGTVNYELVLTEDLNLTSRQRVPNGWIYQQILKSQFWVSGLCENYLSIDSDSKILKDFYYDDFMFDDNTPFTVMSEQKDFLDVAYKLGKVKYEQNNRGWFINSRYYNAIRKIREFIPNTTTRYFDYGPSPYLWSSKVWKSFNDEYLLPNNLTFEQLTLSLGSLMSEAALYGEWLLHSKKIDIIPVNPFFKFYHWKELYDWDKESNITEDDIKKNYLGVVYQSNWS